VKKILELDGWGDEREVRKEDGKGCCLSIDCFGVVMIGLICE
jgi:hypothetical protein